MLLWKVNVQIENVNVHPHLGFRSYFNVNFQRAMRTPDQISKTIEFPNNSVKVCQTDLLNQSIVSF